MTTINPNTGELVGNEGRSPRFTSWIFFLICSVITLKASVEVRNDLDEPNSASKWAVICSAVTFSVTAFVAIFHLVPIFSIFFIGSKIEGFIIFVMMAFWAATVSIVTNTNNDLGAVSSDTNQVSNGNLYYFSWAGFATSVQLFASYLKSSFGVDLLDEVHGRGARIMYWAALLSTSLTVTGSSARVLNEDCEGTSDSSTTYCSRTKLAIALGSIGIVVSIAVVGIKLTKSSPPFVMELVLACLLTVMNAFGVAYITSNSGPGRAIGNLYYSTWISFLLSAYLAVDCLNSSKKTKNAANTTDNSTEAKTEAGEIQVDHLDEEAVARA